MLVEKEHPATRGMNAAVRQRAGAAGLHSPLPGTRKENRSRSGRLGPRESSQHGAHPGFLGASPSHTHSGGALAAPARRHPTGLC